MQVVCFFSLSFVAIIGNSQKTLVKANNIQMEKTYQFNPTKNAKSKADRLFADSTHAFEWNTLSDRLKSVWRCDFIHVQALFQSFKSTQHTHHAFKLSLDTFRMDAGIASFHMTTSKRVSKDINIQCYITKGAKRSETNQSVKTFHKRFRSVFSNLFELNCLANDDRLSMTTNSFSPWYIYFYFTVHKHVLIKFST